jgi:UDP-GlcNAc3NAcA epimerase
MSDTSKKRRIVTVVGARPQFIKAAALRAAFDESPDFHEILVHTGQHYDTNMSGVFFEELGLRPPEHRLSIEDRQHGAMTGQMLAAIERILLEERPDALLVYGDTNSTLAGALASSKLHVPVIHVEAGLRSFNRRMPEEMNRILTDHISQLLFCSTKTSIRNLAAEGVDRGVHLVGDIMYDVALRFGSLADVDALKTRFKLGTRPIAVLTLHRQENFDNAARAVRILDFVASHAAGYDIVFPVHPGTRAKLKALRVPLPGGVKAIGPLSYIDLQGLLKASNLVLTDSGGLQKEAYFHRTPCITLRDETEWVETVDAGWNALWTQPIHKARREIGEYGTGNTAARILAILRQEL